MLMENTEKNQKQEAGAETPEKVKNDRPRAEEKRRTEKTSKRKKDPREKLYQPEHRLMVLNASPHDYQDNSVPKIMWSVVGALIPATAAAIYYFGWPAVRLILACTLSALLTEIVVNGIKKQKLTAGDGSAAVTGLLLALTLPPTLSITSAILGSVFAIAIGKQIFGGLGYNIFNPALIGRAFLQASFPVAMTTWSLPFAEFDGISAATPLGQFKFENIVTSTIPLVTGNIGGCLGETSAIAVLAGGLYLLIRKFADWRIPLSYLGTVFILSGLFWLADPVNHAGPVFHLFAGGLMLGAFFMATDLVTSPITPKGSWIFGLGAGVLVVVIRFFGGLPEGVMYSILLMNCVTPLINRYTRPRFLGEVTA